MIPSCWKGQIACVSELSIEQECLSGVCRPPLLRAFPWEGKGGRKPPFPRLFRRSEMNFELADAGEKEHEWGA